MPKVSVLVCTYRAGGLDLVLGSLAKQTFRDFEIVLVDDLREWRFQKVREFAGLLGLEPKLVYPEHYPVGVASKPYLHGAVPLASAGASLAENKAIVHASGELCLWLCDYSWAPEDWIASHWRAYLAHDRKASAVAGARYLNPPPVKSGLLRGAGKEGASSGDLIHPYAVLPDAQVSIFERPLTEGVSGLDPQVEGQDLRLSMHEKMAPTDTCMFFFKNEGVPRQLLLDLNGVEAVYDPGHLHGDSDLYIRMMMSGWRFYISRACETSIVQVRNIMGTLRWPQIEADTQTALFRRNVVKYMRTKSLRANPGRNLQAEWDALHGS